MRFQRVDQLTGAALDRAFQEAVGLQSPVCAGLSDEQKRQRVGEEFGEYWPVPDELVHAKQEE
ncbi:MAG: hypothetical protein ACQES2_04315 [Pseudomonadota bacterium]